MLDTVKPEPAHSEYFIEISSSLSYITMLIAHLYIFYYFKNCKMGTVHQFTPCLTLFIEMQSTGQSAQNSHHSNSNSLEENLDFIIIEHIIRCPDWKDSQYWGQFYKAQWSWFSEKDKKWVSMASCKQHNWTDVHLPMILMHYSFRFIIAETTFLTTRILISMNSITWIS